MRGAWGLVLGLLLGWQGLAGQGVREWQVKMEEAYSAGRYGDAKLHGEAWVKAAAGLRKGADTAVVAAHVGVADLYGRMHQYALAAGQLNMAEARLAGMPEGTEWRARVDLGYGGLYLDTQNAAGARRHLEAGVKGMEAAGKGNEGVVREALSQLAGLAYMEDRLADAESLYTKLMGIEEQLWGYQSAELARTLNNAGGVYLRQGKGERALAVYRHALNMQKAVLGDTHPEVATTLTNIGVYHDQQGDFDAAEANLLSAFELRAGHLPLNDPLTNRSLDNLIGFYVELGRYTDVEALLGQVMAARTRAAGGSSLGVAAVCDRWGDYWIARQQVVQAEAYFIRALEIREEKLPLHHPEVATTLYNLGKLQYRSGRPGQAVINLNRALECFQSDVLRYEPMVAAILEELFSACYSAGDLEGAEDNLLSLLALKEAAYGKRHAALGPCLRMMGEFYAERGRDVEAGVARERVKNLE